MPTEEMDGTAAQEIFCESYAGALSVSPEA